jgi:hypothetical protein
MPRATNSRRDETRFDGPLNGSRDNVHEYEGAFRCRNVKRVEVRSYRIWI